MGELQTYLFPAIQGLFFLIIAVVWLVGFVRQRNFGFLILAFVMLGESVTNLARQAMLNYVLYHQTHLSVTERTTDIGIMSTVFLAIFAFFWLLNILGALLIVFGRPKFRTPSEVAPPISG
jgi:hypothetical protein